MAFGAYCFGVRDSGDLILQGLGSLKLLMFLVELVLVGGYRGIVRRQVAWNQNSTDKLGPYLGCNLTGSSIQIVGL